jgi:hypothetical protein
MFWFHLHGSVKLVTFQIGVSSKHKHNVEVEAKVLIFLVVDSMILVNKKVPWDFGSNNIN